MVHLFGGFPRMLAAFEALARAAPRDRPATLSRRETADRVRAATGRGLFDRIYAESAPAVRAWIRKLDPLAARWIAEHAYARVLARPGLSPRERELLAVAALAATRQRKQLVAHARGALRCGATPAELDLALSVGSRRAGKPFQRLGSPLEPP
jgi:4-carboxymuconolactone decarboxylase